MNSNFFRMSALQLACVPILILWPMIAAAIPPDDGIPLTVYVYVLVGAVTDCWRVCFCVFLGALIAAMLSTSRIGTGMYRPADATELKRVYSVFAGVGLLGGVVWQLLHDAGTRRRRRDFIDAR